MAKFLVVANWKMNPASYKEAKSLLGATKRVSEAARNVSIVVAPPAIYLRELRSLYKGKKIAFAAQNTHFDSMGSYTGDISPAQIKDGKVSSVIVGHAERRAAGETDEFIRKKVAAVLNEKMTPILCIGESIRNQDGAHYVFVKAQLIAALRDVPAAKIPQVVIAYEPVWAIGSDRPMQARDMHEMAIFIRKTLVEMHGTVGMNVKILYGGAIDETNAVLMLRDGDVDGLLVGRASVQAPRFKALIEAIAEA